MSAASPSCVSTSSSARASLELLCLRAHLSSTFPTASPGASPSYSRDHTDTCSPWIHLGLTGQMHHQPHVLFPLEQQVHHQEPYAVASSPGFSPSQCSDERWNRQVKLQRDDQNRAKLLPGAPTMCFHGHNQYVSPKILGSPSPSTTSSSPDVYDYRHLGSTRCRIPLRLPCTSTPRPDRQVPRERLYLYRRRGSDKYPYNKCTSTVVFGIAKNVKYPFEMTRPASSNDPKYLFETTEYYYHRTLERLQAETSSSSMNHVRLPFLVDSPKYHEMTTLQVAVAVYDYRRLGDVGFIKFLFGKVPLLPSTTRE